MSKHAESIARARRQVREASNAAILFATEDIELNWLADTHGSELTAAERSEGVFIARSTIEEAKRRGLIAQLSGHTFFSRCEGTPTTVATRQQINGGSF